MIKGVIFGLDTITDIPVNISEIKENKDKSRLFIELALLGLQKCVYSKEPLGVMQNIINKLNINHLVNSIVSSVETSSYEYVLATCAKNMGLLPEECKVVALHNQFPEMKDVLCVSNSNEVSIDILACICGDA
jgi:hypothetical protein